MHLTTTTTIIKITFHTLIAVIAEASVPFDRLKAICAQMTKAAQDFRKYLGEVKELHARQIERIQRERDAALMAARVHADVDDPNNIHQMPGVEIATTKKVHFHRFFIRCIIIIIIIQF